MEGTRRYSRAEAMQSLEMTLPVRGESPYSRAFRKLRGNAWAMASMAMLLMTVIAAVFAPQISPFDPLEMSYEEIASPPTWTHWFGTDQFGRDILSRVIYGARFSVPLGVIPVAIGMVFGTVLGLLAGYSRGILRRAIMRLVDVMLGFPLFLLALFIVAMMGPSLINAMIAVGIASTPQYARVVFSSVLSIKEQTYVLSAQSIGASGWHILRRHIMPNIIGPVIVMATMGLAYAILTGAALSFLGLGARPPTPEWGAMVFEGRDYLRSYWWITTLPGLMIVITVLAVNILGDGLRDALDPRVMD